MNHQNWCEQARARLTEMDSLVARGLGDTPIQGGGCTEPGGGIVSSTHTAREIAATLRKLLSTCHGAAGVAGFEHVTPPTYSPPSPWVMGITSSVVGAAVGWAIEEIAVHVRGRRRR